MDPMIWNFQMNFVARLLDLLEMTGWNGYGWLKMFIPLTGTQGLRGWLQMAVHSLKNKF